MSIYEIPDACRSIDVFGERLENLYRAKPLQLPLFLGTYSPGSIVAVANDPKKQCEVFSQNTQNRQGFQGRANGHNDMRSCARIKLAYGQLPPHWVVVA